MGVIDRRGFLKMIIGMASLGTALGLGMTNRGLAKLTHAPRQLENEPLEKRLYERTETEENEQSNNWYIQFVVNKDQVYAQRNKYLLESLVQKRGIHTNIKQISTPDGIKTLIGAYSSMEGAVQDSEKLDDLATKVGIAQMSNKDLPVWRYTVYLTPKEENLEKDAIENKKNSKISRLTKLPEYINKLVEEEVNLHNRSGDYQLNVSLIKAIMQSENAEYNPEKVSYKLVPVPNKHPRTMHKKPYIFIHAVNSKGRKIPTAYGLMMLVPDTMKAVGIDPILKFDPRMNIRAGTRHLGQLLKYFDGDIRLAVAAYSAGSKRVAEIWDVPRIPETIKYVNSVLNIYRSLTYNTRTG